MLGEGQRYAMMFFFKNEIDFPITDPRTFFDDLWTLFNAPVIGDCTSAITPSTWCTACTLVRIHIYVNVLMANRDTL